MPLPWSFDRNWLAPVPLGEHPDAPRAILHVRIFAHPWAGDVVIAGRLTDQPGDFDETLPRIWDRFHDPNRGRPFRFISYGPSTNQPFREHGSRADIAGRPVMTWPYPPGPKDPTASAAEVIQAGPRVDTWDADRYILATFEMARITRRAAPPVAVSST